MDYRFSERMGGMSGSATREIFKLLSRPEIISFAGGFPATQCLPIADVAQIIAEILSGDMGAPALQYGSTEGFNHFREELKRYVAGAGVIAETLDEIQVVSGGQQGIDLACKALLDKGDTVLVEDPTYLTALQIFASYQANIVGVKAGENGLDIEDLTVKIIKYKPKILYVVPTFSNPTGNTYSIENRKAIAEITYKNNVVVLEDDPYAKLRFEGEPLPALKTFDSGGNILYVTSFSKVLSPGLRVGAAVGTKELIRKLAICKQGVDVTTANISQLVVANYLKKGLLQPNIDKSLPIYRERKNAMIAAINAYMPCEYKHTDPHGGLFIWGSIKGLDMATLMPKAIERNVAYIHGSVFHADGGGKDTFRLNFSNASLERIEIGIKALGGMFKEELAKK
ncbi:MAG: PLP-dependent aminotransferase family protein [Firmicutes bacterium]|nr:PLP-dependent aminotransferase family protein [Bacillota bacterium]